MDWVFQLDAPEDVATYIHRVGRTARFGKDGKALLLLAPTEIQMVKLLEDRKVTVIRTEANNSKLNSITPKLKGLCAESPDLKYLAQKCFISYMRSVFLQPNKDVFKAPELPTEVCSRSPANTRLTELTRLPRTLLSRWDCQPLLKSSLSRLVVRLDAQHRLNWILPCRKSSPSSGARRAAAPPHPPSRGLTKRTRLVWRTAMRKRKASSQSCQNLTSYEAGRIKVRAIMRAVVCIRHSTLPI